MVNQSGAVVKPRTKAERRAFIDGWTGAINLIDQKGIREARKWLREMAIAEGIITEEEANGR